MQTKLKNTRKLPPQSTMSSQFGIYKFIGFASLRFQSARCERKRLWPTKTLRHHPDICLEVTTVKTSCVPADIRTTHFPNTSPDVSAALTCSVHAYMCVCERERERRTQREIPTHKLTPQSRHLPEKLTGSQLVKKSPAFYGIRRFITAFKTARHLSLS